MNTWDWLAHLATDAQALRHRDLTDSQRDALAATIALLVSVLLDSEDAGAAETPAPGPATRLS